MTGRSVSAVTAYTAHGNGPRAHPMNGTPAFTRSIDTGHFRTEAVDDDLALREASGRTASLTHWSFGQLATIASAPPNYLRSLPASIASDALNFGLQRVARDHHLGIPARGRLPAPARGRVDSGRVDDLAGWRPQGARRRYNGRSHHDPAVHDPGTRSDA